MIPDGLFRDGGVVVVSGEAVRAALSAVRFATNNRRASGYPIPAWWEELTKAFGQATLAATGQPDVRETPELQDYFTTPPTVPLKQAAQRLNISDRQARRIAPMLGGKKIGGHWYIDHIALEEHLEGRSA